MSLRITSWGGGVALGGLLFLGLASPAVAATCDAYSGTCTTTPPVGPEVVPRVVDRENEGTATEASTLPFTGGELVLMTALGAGAVAGGVALVAAGRRRPTATPE